MKKISLFLLLLGFISCNFDKKISELKTVPKKINADLIGVYEYKTTEQSENHYLIIDTLNGKYNGLYYGSEDSGGHGVFFYGNIMENLNIENNKISFEIGKRDLYETTRLRIVKDKNELEYDSIIGISRSKLKYCGQVLNKGIKLNCDSEYGDCWDDEFMFEKLEE